MRKIVIIADDLTGAADTGVQFCSFFDSTVLVSYLQWLRGKAASLPSSFQAVALYTNSRALAADTARHRLDAVGRRLSEAPPRWIYKKIDSCLRGNPGAETEALMDAMGYGLSFIAPAFPGMGRTTVHDIHRVHGIALQTTELAKDPIAPVSESRLSRLIAAQCRYPVSHVDIGLLEGDEKVLREQIRQRVRQGVRHLVFDAVTDAHLARVARLSLEMYERLLPVGSAGLAAGLGRCLPGGLQKGAGAPPIHGRGHRLLVCGSTSGVTRRQVDALTAACSYRQLRLDPGVLAEPDQDRARMAEADEACRLLSSGHLVITVGTDEESGGRADAAARRRRAESIAKALGHLVAVVLATVRPGLLFLTGGDTADAVLTAAGVGGLQIFGEMTAGVVQGTLMGGTLAGLPVVTKAGAFGREDTLVRLHEIWQKGSEET